MVRFEPRHGAGLEGRGWREMAAGMAYADAPTLTPYAGCARELLLARRREPEDIRRTGPEACAPGPRRLCSR